jgi:hypothetical protein
MKLICILEAAQSENAKREKAKVKVFTKKIIDFLLNNGFDECLLDTKGKIKPCKYQNCPECRFWDVCPKFWTRFEDSKKVMIISGEGRK